MATVLDWSSNGPQGPGSVGPAEPCGLCSKPTIMRSPRGKPCQKTSAEAYLDRQATDQQHQSRQQAIEANAQG